MAAKTKIATHPSRVVLHFPDGTTETIQVAPAKRSPKGNWNAYAGGKIVRQAGNLQATCNFTLKS
jgi:hypothetical protein